ncbi:MAG: ABC transporter permease, partial [Cytophagaceae bacterium]
MLTNYFKIAWRNIVTNKVYSFINIGGLAVGMAVAMLIGLWIWDELSYNKRFANYDRVAQVMQHQTFNGVIQTQGAMPFPIAAELRKSYGSDFKHVIMATWTNNHILSVGDKKFSKKGAYMEPAITDMLTLTMEKG